MRVREWNRRKCRYEQKGPVMKTAAQSHLADGLRAIPKFITKALEITWDKVGLPVGDVCLVLDGFRGVAGNIEVSGMQPFPLVCERGL